MTKPNWTKEPWGELVIHTAPDLVEPFVKMPLADYERAKVCVNDCSGMEDPAAKIERWKNIEFEFAKDMLAGL